MNHRLLVVLASLALEFATAHAAKLRAIDLRCEYLADPVGVDAPQPRLSWVLEAEARGAAQTAYRVFVASTEDALRSDRGDLWDTGRVDSTEQNQIQYSGRPLTANQTCYWKVRVWDRDGRPSPWSRPARWTMGLLEPSDWQARWIQAPGTGTSPLENCRWVWFPEADPPRSAPAGARYFRKALTLPENAHIARAEFWFTADNTGRLFVNGTEAGRATRWETIHSADATRLLRPGPNTLAIVAENTGPNPSPAGLIGKLAIRHADGTELTIPIDGSWRTSAKEEAGWTQAAFDDRTWAHAQELGAFGIEPWRNQPAAVAALPLFRRTFTLNRPLERALVHVCGLGHYELFLDGRKVGDRFLDPAWSVYERTLYYSTYDLTEHLRPGAHAFAVMLGKGFYNTAGDRRVHGVNIDRPLKLILQAQLIFKDGTEHTLVSDASWRTASGPITHSAILGGEDYDARRLPQGWDRPAFDDAAWTTATETDGPGGRLTAALALPMQAHDSFRPVQIDEPKAGVFVYDFGQNASAIPRLKVRGPAGQTLRLTPAEQRHGMTPRRNDGRGLVNPAGVGNPNYFEYTLRGQGVEEWSPQFTYTGFQYLQLEGAVPRGYPNPARRPVVEDLVSVHVRNAASVVGRFECSNPLLNRIDRIVDWAVRANLAHVLTDCPHREKLGWLEVAYLMGPSIAGRYDVARFYSKVSRDCADSQKPDGLVPTVAPAYPAFAGGFAYTPEWGAAAVVVPWLVHEWYGDRAVLEASYPTMKAFVDYLRNTSTDLVPHPGLGDWYDYGHGKPVGPSQFTPPELSAMATFHRCTRIVAETARRLGRADDQRTYETLAADIARAFNARYFDGHAEYTNQGSPQTANSMALVTGLVPAGRESAVIERVIADIRQRRNQQTAGDIGHWYLLEALARAGRHEVIYDLAARTNLGSYGFIVNNLWTSMPEAWDADTGASMNHCMLGHLQEWLFGHVGGIRPDPEAPGFRHFIVAPQPVGDLTWARATYDSIRGPIRSEWKKASGRFQLKLVVPPNTTATVVLPSKDGSVLTERGRPLNTAPGVTLLRRAGATAVLRVASGHYEFES